MEKCRRPARYSAGFEFQFGEARRGSAAENVLVRPCTNQLCALNRTRSLALRSQFYDCNFQVRQRAGLNFYHPHPHMLTGKHLAVNIHMGLLT